MFDTYLCHIYIRICTLNKMPHQFGVGGYDNVIFISTNTIQNMYKIISVNHFSLVISVDLVTKTLLII